MNAQHEVIRKWYRELFPVGKYDAEFEQLLADENRPVPERFSESDAAGNLLFALFRCEELEQKYRAMGIDRQILLDTLSDIVIWTDTWVSMGNEFGLMEIGWLEFHLSMRLFRLGRLQFCAGKTEATVPELGVALHDPIVEVHIPAGMPLSPDECKASFAKAKEFYATYFPQYSYAFFTCHSWLLDKTLEQFLAPDSKILAFQRLFQIVKSDDADDALRYIFRWDAKRENVPQYEAKSGLAKKVKDYALAGGKLYVSYGFIRKETM